MLLPRRQDGHFEVPVVIHIGENGAVRFPGAADAKVPRGFQRIELRSVRELETFERKMNAKLKSEAQDHQEREERHFEAIYAKNRDELRQAMKHFSPMGRAFAEAVIRINNQRKKKPTDVGFHSVILHNDASKEPWIDERTGWKRKYF